MNKKNRMVSIFVLMFIISAGLLFPINDQFIGNKAAFAQQIKKEIYSIQASIKSVDNLISIFLWDMVRGSTLEGVRDEVEPVFMIRNGQLIDPSEEAEKMGFEVFNRSWFVDKTYRVYYMGREAGNLSHFLMRVGGGGRCNNELWGEATFKGKNGWGKPYSIKVGGDNVYLGDSWFFALAKKDGALVSKQKAEEGQITQEQIKKLKEVGSLEFEKMIQRLLRPAKDVEVDLVERRGVSLQAADLDGNGKLDLIGDFQVLLRFRYVGSQKINIKSPAQYAYDLIYAMYDNGTFAIIWPSFQNGIWFDGYSSIRGFFDMGERGPVILLYSSYPTNFVRYQNSPAQYEILGYRNGKGWVPIFMGRPKRYCGN